MTDAATATIISIRVSRHTGRGTARPEEVAVVDNQQRQKIMLAVVAVVALGAGSWFVFLRKPPETNKNAFSQTGEVVRKVRTTTAEDKPTRKKKKRARATRKKAPTVVRRQREEVEERTVERKKRRGKTDKRVKKAKVTPAA